METETSSSKGTLPGWQCENAVRASAEGKFERVSVLLQHFQERSVVCSPEQSERAGENTVPLSRGCAATLYWVSVDACNLRQEFRLAGGS